MWQLRMRDKNKEWIDLGTFEDIGAAARRVLELEREPAQPMISMFFRVYADPLVEQSDAAILSRLEYQGTKGFYLLTRQAQ
jgi:hypothetical protein